MNNTFTPRTMSADLFEREHYEWIKFHLGERLLGDMAVYPIINVYDLDKKYDTEYERVVNILARAWNLTLV